MIRYTGKDGKTYELRNLEEQVFNNLDRITDLEHINQLLNDFGIKLVGEVATENELPPEETYVGTYGDAYAVSINGDLAAPWKFFIWTRGSGTGSDQERDNDHWFALGQFPLPGPQGPKGPAGTPDFSVISYTDNSAANGALDKTEEGGIKYVCTLKIAKTGGDQSTCENTIVIPLKFDDVTVKALSGSTNGKHFLNVSSHLYVHQIKIVRQTAYDAEYEKYSFRFNLLTRFSTSFGSGQTGLASFLSWMNNNLNEEIRLMASGDYTDYDGRYLGTITEVMLNRTQILFSGIMTDGFSSIDGIVKSSNMDWTRYHTHFSDTVTSYLNSSSANA